MTVAVTAIARFRTYWCAWIMGRAYRGSAVRSSVEPVKYFWTTRLSRFIAALVRGEGLSAASRAELAKASLPIGTAHQFPNFAPYLPAARQRPDLAAGLGVVVFEGPQGRGFFKGGHDGQTANSFVCLEDSRRCVLLLANDVRAEARFADLVQFILGETGVPYDWEYGDQAGKS